MTAAITLLPAYAACSFAMAGTGIPATATPNILAIFEDAIMAPLIICALLLVDCFEDTEPAILILPHPTVHRAEGQPRRLGPQRYRGIPLRHDHADQIGLLVGASVVCV
ncbi:hypothetical protein [Paracoccus haeundaensis]|uniref:Uncharacterized protein n=1 Tax=Paracoccus haeundaensis TaxID=225362 RepID=A0A5C4R8U1_9RHOB|nr:hypothetical protein [Paracoccus haeundaensis]TNH40406.1 hypothetical protein FHD67_04130 [Paracoccus haeundaensis]